MSINKKRMHVYIYIHIYIYAYVAFRLIFLAFWKPTPSKDTIKAWPLELPRPEAVESQLGGHHRLLEHWHHGLRLAALETVRAPKIFMVP